MEHQIVEREDHYCFCNKRTLRKKQFIFSVIVNRAGSPIAFSHNSYNKTNPLQAKWAARCGLPAKQFVHAEVAAIAKLSPAQREKAYAIYVYRFDRSGRPANAKPCKICQTVIKECTSIKHIYYTTENDSLDMSYERYQRYYKRHADQWCDEDCR